MESTHTDASSFFIGGIYTSQQELFDMLNKPVGNTKKEKEILENSNTTQADKFKKSFFSDIIIS